MPLNKSDKAFAYGPICVINPRQVPLERTLGNLILYLETGGRPLSPARKTITLAELMEHLRTQFDIREKGLPTLQRWLLSEFIETEPGSPSLRQASITGGYPIHATAIKLQMSTAYRDFQSGLFVYSVLLQHDQVRRDLKDFFWTGLEEPEDRKRLDIETLFFVQALDEAQVRTPKHLFEEPEIPQPYCRGGAALFANDVRRLLLYKDVVPRREFIRYLIALMGFHIALYYLRLLRAIPSLLETGRSCDQSCQPRGLLPPCPFQCPVFLDASDDYKSKGAQLAQAEVDRVYGLIPAYVRAHLSIKKLAEFGEEWATLGRLGGPAPETLADVVALRQHPELPQWADHRILNVLADDEALQARFAEIKALTQDSFARYVELIFPDVFRLQGGRVREALDTFAGKNKPYGFMRAGRGHRRRFALSTGLLELLIQLAVVDYDEDTGHIFQRNLTVTELLDWLDQRYGLLIDRTAQGQTGFDVERAMRENLAHFKSMLRELGYFIGLSDASNVQYVTPRFELEGTIT